MINPYCRPLHGLFAELSYYGLLKAEDAQCLRADVAVEPSFYVLFCGTLVLALLNSFVMKANFHYLRDKDFEESGSSNVSPTANSLGINQLDDLSDYEGEGNRPSIRPVPVLFTDRFRWLLYREDTMSSTNGSFDEQRGTQIERPVEQGYDTDVLWDGRASDA